MAHFESYYSSLYTHRSLHKLKPYINLMAAQLTSLSWNKNEYDHDAIQIQSDTGGYPVSSISAFILADKKGHCIFFNH